MFQFHDIKVNHEWNIIVQRLLKIELHWLSREQFCQYELIPLYLTFTYVAYIILHFSTNYLKTVYSFCISFSLFVVKYGT